MKADKIEYIVKILKNLRKQMRKSRLFFKRENAGAIAPAEFLKLCVLCELEREGLFHVHPGTYVPGLPKPRIIPPIRSLKR